MPIRKFDANTLEQLALQMDIPEEVENGISPDEAKRISMAAQQALEQHWEGVDEQKVPAWLEDY